jgi:heptosyltransferase I
MNAPIELGERPRICIVMLTAAGDVVHGLPLVAAIRRHRPRAHIAWVIQPGPATLIHGHPAIDEIIPFERARGLGAFAGIRGSLAGRRYDVTLALQVYLKAGIVTSFVRSPVKLGFDRARARDLNWLFTNRQIPPHAPQHMQDQYLEFLAPLGVAPEPLEWEVGPWDSERGWQREFFAPLDRPAVAFVIGTSKSQKDWLPERWAALGDTLYKEFGLQPVLVGGRSARELDAETEIMANARHRPVSALGSGLRRVVSILDGCALVVSPDTGPLHIAVALNRPVISLMGYTNPKRTGPYRRFHDLMVDAYGNPGEDYAPSSETRRHRMASIAVTDVLDRVGRWAAHYRDRDRL